MILEKPIALEEKKRINVVALWDEIASIFDQLTQFVPDNYISMPGETEQLREAAVQLKDHLRVRLNELRERLAQDLNEQSVYYILFALVLLCDELVHDKLASSSDIMLPSLQKELLETEVGGNLFYSVIDEILSEPNIHDLVYEVYFYCLKLGFKGQFHEEPQKIDQYKKRLQSRIAIVAKAMQEDQSKLEAEPEPLTFKSKLRYYYIWLSFPVLMFILYKFI